jgi:hypothetical protein
MKEKIIGHWRKLYNEEFHKVRYVKYNYDDKKKGYDGWSIKHT